MTNERDRTNVIYVAYSVWNWSFGMRTNERENIELNPRKFIFHFAHISICVQWKIDGKLTFNTFHSIF